MDRIVFCPTYPMLEYWLRTWGLESVFGLENMHKLFKILCLVFFVFSCEPGPLLVCLFLVITTII